MFRRLRERIEMRKMVRRANAGMAAIEFAVIVPVFLVLLMGAVDMGQMLFAYYKLDQAVASGSQYAVLNASLVNSTSGTTLANNIATIVESADGSAWANDLRSREQRSRGQRAQWQHHDRRHGVQRRQLLLPVGHAGKLELGQFQELQCELQWWRKQPDRKIRHHHRDLRLHADHQDLFFPQQQHAHAERDGADAMKRQRRRFWRAIAATTSIEFAILAVPFLGLVMGIVEFGRACWTLEALQESVQQGARCVAVQSTSCYSGGAVQFVLHPELCRQCCKRMGRLGAHRSYYPDQEHDLRRCRRLRAGANILHLHHDHRSLCFIAEKRADECEFVLPRQYLRTIFAFVPGRDSGS